MPTYERLPRFDRDHAALSKGQRAAFKAALVKFSEDLKWGKGFRKGLRVKGVKGSRGVFELICAGDRRATFSFGAAIREGEPHVVWRRVGTHDIL